MLYNHMVFPYTEEEDLETLRLSGCYWPSDEDILTVFRVVTNLAVAARLADAPEPISFSRVMGQLSNKPYQFERHSSATAFYEYSGFFSEFYLLGQAGLLDFNQFNEISEGKVATRHEVILTREGRAMLEMGYDPQELAYEVLSMCSMHVRDLEYQISERCRRHNNLDVLMRFSFRHLRERIPNGQET